MSKHDLTTNEGLRDSLVAFAKNSFNPSSPLFPMFVIVAEDGQSEVVSAVFDGEEGTKDAVAKLVREHVKKLNAVRIGFMAEAWALSSEDDGTISRHRPTGSLEFHPKRREVIHIIVEDKWGKGAMAVLDINRISETEATLTDSGKDFRKEGASYSGRFANFFDVKHETTH